LRNKFEHRTYDDLKKRKVKFSYETEKFPYTIESKYIPDFPIVTKSGKKFYVECKGYLRPEDKRKLVAVKKCNPELDVRILFYAYNKKNIKWANKNGYRYAIGTIPQEWLDE